MKNKSWFVFTLVTGLLVASCQQQGPQPPEQPENPAGMANPASVYCMAAGYVEINRTDDSGGEYGVCSFPDGTECESWAFFRGECGQNNSFCVQRGGGRLEVNDGEVTCVFPDGTSCPEFDFAQGQCGPAK